MFAVAVLESSVYYDCRQVSERARRDSSFSFADFEWGEAVLLNPNENL